MDINFSGVLDSIFDKHNSKFMELSHCNSDDAKQQVDFVKTILMEAEELGDKHPFIKRYIEDDSVCLIKLTHLAKESTIRVVTKFQGDSVIVDIPLVDSDARSGRNKADLKSDGVVNIYFKNETMSFALDENAMESLAASDEDVFYFPSQTSSLNSIILTEASVSPGAYLKRKMMEMMEEDPLFALNAILSSGDIEGALNYIYEQDLDHDIFKKDLSFLLVSGLNDSDLYRVLQGVEKLGVTALLDDLSPSEISHLMSIMLANKDVWSGGGAAETIKILITDSSKDNIERFQRAIEQLSLVPVPEPITAMINAEIANNYISTQKPGRRARLKL